MPCHAMLGTVTTTVLHGTAWQDTVRVNADRAQTVPAMHVCANHAPKPLLRVRRNGRFLEQRRDVEIDRDLGEKRHPGPAGGLQTQPGNIW